RHDSELHRALILKKTEADLTMLWNLALAGRDQVRALRTAALADGIDDEKRAEMLAVANAVDGAKERQKQLAKQIARSVGIYAESPIYNIANSAEDATRSQNPFGGSTWTPGRSGPSPGDATPAPSQYALLHPEDMQQHLASQRLFDNFATEYLIRDDMAVAAKHAKAAMQLGGCSPN
ncbi:MAG TPA: hypothetical protein VFE70_07520, partial [Candidatus Elarobacter sp.]|nr:hypothetical protein [Candidatus Elarobacter sp.]